MKLMNRSERNKNIMKTVAIDVETTGLPDFDQWGTYYPPHEFERYDNARIVAIAIVAGDFEKYSVICPDSFQMTEKALAIHGLEEETIRKEGIALADFFTTDVMRVLESVDRVIAHNVNFELCVLASEVCRSRLANVYRVLANVDTYCTMTHGQTFLHMRNWPRLTELYKNLFPGETFQAHHALYDAKATLRCYQHMMDHAEK